MQIQNISVCLICGTTIRDGDPQKHLDELDGSQFS